MQLDGKTFIVSGGSSGLGAACVTEFARGGANVVICDVSDRGADLARELGDSVRFAKTDVTNSEQLQSAVDLAAETLRRIARRDQLRRHRDRRARHRARGTAPARAVQQGDYGKLDRLVQRHPPRRRQDAGALGRAGRGPRGHHQHRVGCSVRRADRASGIFGLKGRDRRFDACRSRASSRSIRFAS